MPLDRDLISSSSPIACRDRWSFAESKPPANRVVSTNEFWTDPESDDYVPEAVPEMMMISRMAI
jgi:hypothetical protein